MTDIRVIKSNTPGVRGASVQAEQGSLGKLAALNRENPSAATLMLILMAKMDNKGALEISQAALAKLCNCSLSTVKRTIAYLVEGSWVQAVDLPLQNRTPTPC